nr:cytochrome b-c1 complex subunit 7 [Quercus suber]
MVYASVRGRCRQIACFFRAIVIWFPEQPREVGTAQNVTQQRDTHAGSQPRGAVKEHWKIVRSSTSHHITTDSNTRTVAIMSVPSLAPAIMKRPWLKKWFEPLAGWYFDNAGYRKLGLRSDDLIPEESEAVQLALKRLPPKEAYDRVYRMRRAFQLSLSHQLLPQEEWTKSSDDHQYLSPIIKAIEQEIAERTDLDSMVISKPKTNGSKH